MRIFDASFWMLFAGQLGIAVAQPFVVNGISKLVADWFSEEQGAIATGLGTMGMFLGMAAGMAATPALVDAFGLRATMVDLRRRRRSPSPSLFALVVRPNAERAGAQPTQAVGGFRPLCAIGACVTLFLLSLLGLGVFNGLTTWLEQILAPHGIDSERRASSAARSSSAASSAPSSSRRCPIASAGASRS